MLLGSENVFFVGYLVSRGERTDEVVNINLDSIGSEYIFEGDSSYPGGTDASCVQREKFGGTLCRNSPFILLMHSFYLQTDPRKAKPEDIETNSKTIVEVAGTFVNVLAANVNTMPRLVGPNPALNPHRPTQKFSLSHPTIN